ncbi:MAG: glycosyltransferase family 4 protein [Acidobacteriota bacterium]|nr:MAG: glycosyltransferase family 4 protein [Acidobacteriota bacterium]
MRVALDAIPLVAAKTGIGHYTDALAEWLARVHREHQYELFSPFDFEFDPCNGKPANLSKRFIPVRSIFRKWWLVGLPSFLRISPVDIFHGTNYCIPVFAPCPTIVTVHDMSLLAQSGTHESENVRRGKRRLPIMIRRATMIISPSEWTKQEIIRYLGTRPEKIRVIHEGAREKMRPLPEAEIRGVLEKHGIHSQYLLYVGTIEPRKNLVTLIRAYHELLRETPHRPRLVLCGGRGWLEDEVFKLVEELKLQDEVRFTGYVDDADLPALYSGAEAFIYPSVYEGFGLPPLEAMACGTPVITSNVSSLPEVVGGAGLLHDPQDHRALTRHIATLLGDRSASEKLERAGIEQASRFSWERAARETQALYDEVFEKWNKP